MTYCHECGSEVSGDDVFCPYCGITLQSSAAASAASEANPITETPEKAVFDATEKDNLVNVEKNVDAGSDAVSATQTQTAENVQIKEASTAEKSENSEKTLQENNSEYEVENPELKKPEIDLSDSETENNSPVSVLVESDQRKSVEADAFGNPIVDQSDLPEIPIAADKSEIPAAEVNQTESSIMSYDEAKLKEWSADGKSVFVAGGEDSFEATIPYIPPAKSRVEKIPQNLIPKDNTTSEKENNKTFSASPIAKPEIDLEIPEPQNSQSRIDSVRIIETEKPKEEKFVENVPHISGQNDVGNEFPADSAQQEKAGRSYTTPNFGGTTDGKKSAKLKPLDEGTVLNGRYEIVRKIGGGGMGAVYLASDKNLGGVLRAVKEMVQSYIEDEQQEKAIADFKRESTLLTSLEHQSIPTIYDYFFDEKEARFYLVMKYISGGDLAARLRAAPENRLDEQSVTEWGIQIADVLDYLHNRQPPIVYRDLKPSNIMIDGNSGRAMLIDFGIARWVNKEEKGVTAIGTMGYAPPELFSGNVEPRSDIYSLGSTMFHLLTGADPQSNPLLIFDFQKHPRPRQINPQLSDQIEKILMHAVEYSADKRFLSALELKLELEKHLEKLKTNTVSFGIKEAPQSIALSEQPVFCGFCGQKIVATDMFCAFCGAKQPMAQQGVHSQHASAKPVTAQLLIVGTNELETPAFTIEKDDNLLGRRDPMSNIFPEVDLSKYDPQTKISRRHARIRREGSSFLVEDLGSSNGTIVIPAVKQTIRLMPHKPYALENGDKLKLGDTTLHFISG